MKLDETEEEKKRFPKAKVTYKPLTDWWKAIRTVDALPQVRGQAGR